MVLKTLNMSLGVPYRGVELVAWPWAMALTRRDWRGQEHLGKHGEGIVVAPNHISFIDPLVMAHFLHDSGRPPRFMGKESVFEAPIVGQILKGAGQIPIKRDADPSKALANAVDAVRNGECLVMYPEGTLTRDPHVWPMKGRTGALRVALAADAPLIPVAQWGANKIQAPYAKELWLLPPKLIQMRVGPPINLDDMRGKRLTKAMLEEGTERLMDAITTMLADIRGETPPAERLDWVAERKRQAAAEAKEDF